MKIDSKDYGVLFKLLVAGRITELDKLLEEISPGHFWEWPIEFSCWFWPKWTKKQIMDEAERVYNEEGEIGEGYGIWCAINERHSKASYWCGPVFGAHTRKEFEKECSKRKVRFIIDEDLYNEFCEPKKRTRNYRSNSNMRQESGMVDGS